MAENFHVSSMHELFSNFDYRTRINVSVITHAKSSSKKIQSGSKYLALFLPAKHFLRRKLTKHQEQDILNRT